MPIRKKILNGLSVTAAEWNEYLILLHSNLSGVTRPFAKFKTTLGPNTYEVLAAKLPLQEWVGKTVVDLACGDGFFTQMLWRRMGKKGHLVGIDLVPEEIERAKQELSDPRVQWKAEAANALTLASCSVDGVFCHLGLMLMQPLPGVLKEVARILKPKGWVQASVSAPLELGSPLSFFMQKVETFIRDRYPKYAGFSPGDLSLRTPEGIESAMVGAFGNSVSVSLQNYAMKLEGTPEILWKDFFSTLHATLILKGKERRDLEEFLIHEMALRSDKRDQVALALPLRLISLVKN